MTSRLAHRGPDGEGYLCGPQVSLGHRRLAVIDLDNGQQPMTTPDGRFSLVFNGEIYNYRELREDLARSGVKFSTQSDTEVLLHTFARGGIRAIERLRGMFAFAVWDALEETLWLVRDRLGVKPLYYTVAAGQILFASEMKALLAHPSVSRRLNPLAVDDFLALLYVPAPQTIFEGICELPPAHWLRWQRGKHGISRYWDALPSSFDAGERKEADLIEETRARVAEAVRLRLVSDVPLGAFLSGGLDSTSIVACMAQAQPAAPVRSFSLGFGAGEERYTEIEYARLVARQYATQHVEIEIRPQIAALLPLLTSHFDEPFGNPTALLLYELSRRTRGHVTVALAGDAGDEIFLGYPRYAGALLQSRMARLPLGLRNLVSSGAALIRDNSSGAHLARRVREFLESAALPWQDAYIRWVSYFGAGDRAGLYTPEFRAAVGGYRAESFLQGWFARATHAHPLDQVSYVDLHSFLPHNLLEYGDRMSMAHGLEVRLPFTDHKLVEFAMRVPGPLKKKGGSAKYLLREAMRPQLPRQVLDRRKLGLNPPLAIWLRDELSTLVDEQLSAESIRRTGWFRPEAVRKLVEDFRSGRRDYSLHIWSLLALEQWRRQILENEEVTGMNLLRATA